jgi:hypothetical protein
MGFNSGFKGLKSHGICGIIGGKINIYFGRDFSASY